MYMRYAIRTLIELRKTYSSRSIHRSAYSLGEMDCTPAEIGEPIKKRIPAYHIEYAVDPRRQAIADSWPQTLDDSAAREEWHWAPRFGLDAMVDEMLQRMH